MLTPEPKSLSNLLWKSIFNFSFTHRLYNSFSSISIWAAISNSTYLQVTPILNDFNSLTWFSKPCVIKQVTSQALYQLARFCGTLCYCFIVLLFPHFYISRHDIGRQLTVLELQNNWNIPYFQKMLVKIVTLNSKNLFWRYITRF